MLWLFELVSVCCHDADDANLRMLCVGEAKRCCRLMGVRPEVEYSKDTL